MPTTTIQPYKLNGVWVFDDPRVGLTKEPFVRGTTELIDQALSGLDIDNAEQGFKLEFSDVSFPGWLYHLNWLREEDGGNRYHCPDLDMECWLCPALFQYFEDAPKLIYVGLKP